MLGNRFMDASASLPSGLLDGTFSSFGDYDQCLQISGSQKELEGKYCIVKLDFKASDDLGKHLTFFPLNVGTCVPQACTPQDVRFLFQETLDESVISVASDAIFCDTQDSIGFFGRLSFPNVLSM